MSIFRPYVRRAKFWGVGRGFVAVAAALVPSLAGAQDREAKPAPAKGAVPVLLVEHAGCAGMFVDPKDQALKNALGMLPERIGELPEEIPALAALPMPVVDFFLTALTERGRLAVTYNPNDQSGGAFGAGVVLSVGPMEEKAAAEMQETVSGLVAQSPLGAQVVDSTVYKGMSETPTPVGGLLRFGPRKAADGWRYEIHFGTAPDPDAAFAALPGPPAGAPADFKPTLRARLDLAPLEPFAQMLVAMAGGRAKGNGGDEDQPGGRKGPNPAKMFMDRLHQSGLMGPDAVKYTYQAGTTKDGQVAFMVVEGMKKFAEARGGMGSPVSDRDLAIIPADATVAMLSKGGIGAIVKSLKDEVAAEPELRAGLDRAKTETGVDLLGDLLGSLGETVAVYMSDTTGGGELGSAVAVIGLKDRAKFQAAHDKLVAYLMEKAEESGSDGHVRVRQWSHAGATLNTLTFPGLPVPLEMTGGFQGDWLVLGLTPQAVISASQLLGGGGKGPAGAGLRDNKAFAAVYPRDNRAVSSVTFVDTPRLMRTGYQYVSMFGSAVANLTRSAVDPDAPDREPGLVVPTYAELREGARPMISFSYWRGNDLVTEAHADRSMLVNGAGVIGAAAPVFPVVGALIGAGAGAGAAQGGLRGLGHRATDEVIVHP